MEINLSINTKDVVKKITAFISTQVTSAGYSKAVINLSGGIDSAVSFSLAVKALGAQNVLALRLPYRTSAPASLEHAQLLIDQAGCPSKTIDITAMAESFFSIDPEMSAIRKGNVMARVRMIIAYDQSMAFNGLVVGTGNKTEILLGYTTLYGDAACAFNPIGELYKTQVRQLARAIKIPEDIITKAPSADLWLGQTDEGELGFTYEDVDKLLFLLYEKKQSPQECIKAGFSEEFVHKVIERIRKSQFKRVMPPIARL